MSLQRQIHTWWTCFSSSWCVGRVARTHGDDLNRHTEACWDLHATVFSVPHHTHLAPTTTQHHRHHTTTTPHALTRNQNNNTTQHNTNTTSHRDRRTDAGAATTARPTSTARYVVQICSKLGLERWHAPTVHNTFCCAFVPWHARPDKVHDTWSMTQCVHIAAVCFFFFCEVHPFLSVTLTCLLRVQ